MLPRTQRVGGLRASVRLGLVSAVALSTSLWALDARADARTEARKHFKAGMALVAEKKLVEGIAELERAYEIYPHPNVAFNVATAQAELGRYDRAIAAYRTYLDSNPADRAEVEKVVAELQEKLDAQNAQKPAPPVDKPTADKPIPDKPPLDKPVGPVAPVGPLAPVAPGPPNRPSEGPTAPTPQGPNVAEPPTSPSAPATRREDVYEETIVTASRGAQSPLDAPNSTTIITRQDIRLSGQTRIPELLRRAAGMDVMQITGGDTNVSMRGFNSRQANKVLVLINGRAVYNDILGSTFWESLSIDVDQIERIEIVRGPGSALYGADAFAGVINIITIAPGAGRSGARVGIGDGGNGYGSGWLTGSIGGLNYRASLGYTQYARWSREAAADRRDVTTASPNQNIGAENLRADLRFNYRIDKDNQIDFGGGYTRATLDVYGIGPFNDFSLQGEFADVGVGYQGKYFNVRTYYSRLDGTASKDYDYVGHTLDVSHPNSNVFDLEAEYVNTFRFPEALQHDVHLGAGYRLKDITWEYLEQPTPIEHHGSLYLQDTIKIGEKVNLVASGRLDYVPYLNSLVGSPRGSIVIKPTSRQAIRITASTAFRTPSFLESYLSLPIQLSVPGVQFNAATAREDATNYKLQPEQITSAEIGYLNQMSDSFEVDFAAYYNRVTNLIELSSSRPETLSDKSAGIGGFDPATGRYTAAFGGWDNSGDVYNVFGGEIGVRIYPVEGLDLFANYALNYTSQQHATPGPDDQRESHHKINAGVQLRTAIGFNGEVSFYYQSSEVWSEQVATLSGVVYQQFPLPAYSLLNGRLGWRFYKNKIEVSATVFNALAGIAAPAPQMHPFGNQIGRRFMGFVSYSL